MSSTLVEAKRNICVIWISVFTLMKSEQGCLHHRRYHFNLYICLLILAYINIVVDGTTDESKVCAGKLLGRNEMCRRGTFFEENVTIDEDVDDFCGVYGYKRDKYVSSLLIFWSFRHCSRGIFAHFSGNGVFCFNNAGSPLRLGAEKLLKLQKS